MDSICKEKIAEKQNMNALIEEKLQADKDIRHIFTPSQENLPRSAGPGLDPPKENSSKAEFDEFVSRANDEIQKMEDLSDYYRRDREKLRLKLEESEMDKMIQIERLKGESNKLTVEIKTFKDRLDEETRKFFETEKENENLAKTQNKLLDE
jgi:hypothetical protein